MSNIYFVDVECGHCDTKARFNVGNVTNCSMCKKQVCPFCIGLGKACPLWDGSYKDKEKPCEHDMTDDGGYRHCRKCNGT